MDPSAVLKFVFPTDKLFARTYEGAQFFYSIASCASIVAFLCQIIPVLYVMPPIFIIWLVANLIAWVCGLIGFVFGLLTKMENNPEYTIFVIIFSFICRDFLKISIGPPSLSRIQVYSADAFLIMTVGWVLLIVLVGWFILLAAHLANIICLVAVIILGFKETRH